MHRPKPKYGWHGLAVLEAPNASIVTWDGRSTWRDIVQQMRTRGVRTLNELIQRTPDPRNVPDTHFTSDLFM